MDFSFLDFLGNYAFPVAVTAFLLWERSKTQEKLRLTVEKNTEAVQALVNMLNRP